MPITPGNSLSRRSFLSFTGAAALASILRHQTAGLEKFPIGLQLYAMRDPLAKDFFGTVRALAKLGYQDMEFYGTYLTWTTDYAKKVRSMMDDLGIRSMSNHTEEQGLTPDALPKAIELNQILGARYIVLPRPGTRNTLDGFKQLADLLNQTSDRLHTANMTCGYHNHAFDFQPLENMRPIDILTSNTKKEVFFELNVGTCLEGGGDPVAFINENPGRIPLMHCTDWAAGADEVYPPMMGEGIAPWKRIFRAAEETGGLKCYVLQQEGTHLPPLEMAGNLLSDFHKLRG